MKILGTKIYPSIYLYLENVQVYNLIQEIELFFSGSCNNKLYSVDECS